MADRRLVMDKVIFRIWPDGDVIALFPQIAATIDGYMCDSYMHVGQHGAASPEIIRNTRPAKKKEYKELLKELEQIGYNPTVVKRFTYADYQLRKSQYKGM